MIKLSTFTYQRRFIISFWRDTSVGNCQDYAWTTLKRNVGGTMNALIALFTFKAKILRARSPSNHWWWPRHAVLKYKGQWIDSTEREWRASPEPHKPLWPALPAPITIALVAALSWLLLTGQVFAQQGQCGEREALVAFLNNKYGETRHAQALAGPTTLMELWVNEDTQTWTITFMQPSGVTCLMASGENFEEVAEQLPPEGDVN